MRDLPRATALYGCRLEHARRRRAVLGRIEPRPGHQCSELDDDHARAGVLGQFQLKQLTAAGPARSERQLDGELERRAVDEEGLRLARSARLVLHHEIEVALVPA